MLLISRRAFFEAVYPGNEGERTCVCICMYIYIYTHNSSASGVHPSCPVSVSTTVGMHGLVGGRGPQLSRPELMLQSENNTPQDM